MNNNNNNKHNYQNAPKSKILVDSSHHEETRVVVLKNNNIEEYEFEVTTKTELKGNIYLARVVKVESSLQAAFVDYGSKRQGFLPFSEIDISYFSISDSEKEKLHQQLKSQSKQQTKDTTTPNATKINESPSEDNKFSNENETQQMIIPTGDDLTINHFDNHDDSNHLEEIFNEANILQQLESENLAYGTRFGYKIQEVIKPDQYIIVQVVKEERGNKGASLTSYLSIPGRCCVYMPFTISDTRISKKIVDANERKRLKDLIEDLSETTNTNIIIRTASLNKTDDEIIQDYRYVTTVWEAIQQQAHNSKNPRMLFEEANLLKRVIRDIYYKEIDEIIINDKQSYENIRNYASMVSPDTLKKIIKFNHPKISLFKYYKVEDEVRNMYSPVVFLKSGGYIVINPTEALVSIDINSGKSTGKRNVEETALKTNLEATTEILKQIKLRDLGGLIVVDYIDMENPKNRSIVEKKVRELAKEDKARLQVGQISQFGLLEISRQRIKASLVERSFNVCPKCQGVGYVKPLEINSLHILRNLQNDAEKFNTKTEYEKITISMPSAEAFYILNNKRDALNDLEKTLKANIKIVCDDTLDFPFYKFAENNDTTDDNTVSFIEQEIEINNKIKDKQIKNKHNNNNKKHNNNRNHFKVKKVESVAKKGFFKKLFGG